MIPQLTLYFFCHFSVRLDQYYEINYGLKKMGLVKDGPNMKDKPCGRELGDGNCHLCLGKPIIIIIDMKIIIVLL